MEHEYDDKKRDDLVQIHKEVVGLASDIQNTVNLFLAKKAPTLEGWEKFLIVSRAINIQSVRWYRHLHDSFDAEERLEQIMESQRTEALKKIKEE